MKNIKLFLSLALALVFICTGAIAVSASVSLPAQSPQLININSDTPNDAISDEAANAETVVGDNATLPVLDGDTAVAEESQKEQQPQPDQKKSSNTPYFVGAVIALIVFIGVALYCKFNGGGAIR